MRRLTNVERLNILFLQSLHADPDQCAMDCEKVTSWIIRGHEWALSWEYDYFDREAHPLDGVVDETSRIFSMFRHIQQSVSAAGIDDDEINKTLIFEGFDGNNDDHFGVARTLVRELGRFTDVTNAIENSHSAGSLLRYRRMLKTYASLTSEQALTSTWHPLSKEELALIAHS